MVLLLQAHGTRSSDSSIFNQRGIPGGGVVGISSEELGTGCVVMICPTQTAMFLTGFLLLSRLKDWAAPEIRMVVRICQSGR